MAKIGHDICDCLKAIRREIAQKNGIPINIPECEYEGPCIGTCPQCESEVKMLEQALQSIHNPNILGCGVHVCQEHKPSSQTSMIHNYLVEYKNSKNNKEMVKMLQETIAKLEKELEVLQQQPADKQDSTKIYQRRTGIRNLIDTIEQLKK